MSLFEPLSRHNSSTVGVHVLKVSGVPGSIAIEQLLPACPKYRKASFVGTGGAGGAGAAARNRSVATGLASCRSDGSAALADVPNSANPPSRANAIMANGYLPPGPLFLPFASLKGLP